MHVEWPHAVSRTSSGASAHTSHCGASSASAPGGGGVSGAAASSALAQQAAAASGDGPSASRDDCCDDADGAAASRPPLHASAPRVSKPEVEASIAAGGAGEAGACVVTDGTR